MRNNASLRSAGWALAILLTLLGAMPALAREGFGMLTKKAASLTRVTPPAVFLMRPKIQVKVSSSRSDDSGPAQRLQSQLESELISRDSRLVSDPERPETLIEVTILQNDSNEKWEKRQELATRQVGKDSKGKPVFETYPVEVNYKIVTHDFGAAYKVKDLQKGGSLDADTVQSNFKDDFREGKNAPEIFTLESSAIGRVVDAIARRITPTRESIGVLLPKGSLGDLGNLAEAGQWNRYLEAVEKKPASAKPADESYRQYALGAAYEALGYAAEEPEVTLKYLEQASIYYGKALETNPGEKYFAQAYDSVWSGRNVPPPLDRVQTALVNYRRLKDFRDNYDSMVAAKAAESSKSLDKPVVGQIDNAAVIRMVKAGLEQAVILKAIDAAPSHGFDISPNGLIQLAEEKVDKRIILHIQEIASDKKPAAAKPAALHKKKPGQG
jgi:hypothetical protein